MGKSIHAALQKLFAKSFVSSTQCVFTLDYICIYIYYDIYVYIILYIYYNIYMYIYTILYTYIYTIFRLGKLTPTSVSRHNGRPIQRGYCDVPRGGILNWVPLSDSYASSDRCCFSSLAGYI